MFVALLAISTVFTISVQASTAARTAPSCDPGSTRSLVTDAGAFAVDVRGLVRVHRRPGGPAFARFGVNNVNGVPTVFAALEAVLGPATVLVNNAARDDRHGWEGVTPEYYDERIAANLRHMFFAIQAVAPGMIAAGKGSIVNFGSNSWWQASGGMPVYTTAKAAVHGMTRSFARDLGPHRIRVNTVVPGWVMTERQKALWATPEALERHRARQCLPDLVEPAHLARMVLFLASDDAAMCTANNYMVEAGSI
jgi:NAD(P)-dependent dehydrogenase (short-subunit alcohol dehydrogenase family)